MKNVIIILFLFVGIHGLSGQIMTNNGYAIYSDTFDASILTESSSNNSFQLIHSLGQASPMLDTSSGTILLQSGYLPVPVYNFTGYCLPTLMSINVNKAQDRNSYIITWQAIDPNTNSSISIFYSKANSGDAGTLIVQGLKPKNNQYLWNVTAMTNGTYYILGKIQNTNNPPIYAYSGQISLTEIANPKYNQPKIEVDVDLSIPARQGNFTIGINLIQAGNITVELYDIQGNRVAQIIENQYFDYGYYTIPWQASPSLGSGVYWLVMKGNGFVKRKRIAIVR